MSDDIVGIAVNSVGNHDIVYIFEIVCIFEIVETADIVDIVDIVDINHTIFWHCWGNLKQYSWWIPWLSSTTSFTNGI